jgi:hypothetical protein
MRFWYLFRPEVGRKGIVGVEGASGFFGGRGGTGFTSIPTEERKKLG